MILYNFLSRYFPARTALILAVLGYGLLLFLFVLGYSSVDADLRYARV